MRSIKLSIERDDGSTSSIELVGDKATPDFMNAAESFLYTVSHDDLPPNVFEVIAKAFGVSIEEAERRVKAVQSNTPLN